jgi:uncharacterized protein (TIGR02611 family)
MLNFLKSYWHDLAKAPPGERFERLHRRRRSAHTSLAKRTSYLIAGFAVMVLGLIMMPAPGPGTLVFLAGGAMVAHESLWAAQAMDALEVRARRLLAAALQRWRQFKTPTNLRPKH